MTLSTATAGATIFYTTNGTNPTHTGGTATGTTHIYTTQISVVRGVDMVITAIAYKAGLLDSVVTSYEVDNTGGNRPLGGGGLVIRQSVTTVETVFSVWDGDWALLEEYAPGNVRTEGYVQGYHGLVKTLVAQKYYYQDSLGSTSHLANASGALVESYRYDLYGKPQYYDALNNQLSASSYGVVDLGNGGARWIPELGLYDDRNRFMSPDTGVFLQPDPIGFKGDASNLYRYCGNDWANKTDPMGLDGTQTPLQTEYHLEHQIAYDKAMEHALSWGAGGAIAIGRLEHNIGQLQSQLSSVQQQLGAGRVGVVGLNLGRQNGEFYKNANWGPTNDREAPNGVEPLKGPPSKTSHGSVYTLQTMHGKAALLGKVWTNEHLTLDTRRSWWHLHAKLSLGASGWSEGLANGRFYDFVGISAATKLGPGDNAEIYRTQTYDIGRGEYRYHAETTLQQYVHIVNGAVVEASLTVIR